MYSLFLLLSSSCPAVKPQMSTSPLKKGNGSGFNTISGKPTPHIVNPSFKEDNSMDVSVTTFLCHLLSSDEVESVFACISIESSPSFPSLIERSLFSSTTKRTKN